MSTSPANIEFSAFDALIGRPGNVPALSTLGTNRGDDQLDLQNLLFIGRMRDPDLPNFQVCDPGIAEFGKKRPEKSQRVYSLLGRQLPAGSGMHVLWKA